MPDEFPMHVLGLQECNFERCNSSEVQYQRYVASTHDKEQVAALESIAWNYR